MNLTDEEAATLVSALANEVAVLERILIPGELGDEDYRAKVIALLRRVCADEETAEMTLAIARENLSQAVRSQQVARDLGQEATKALLRDEEQ